MIKFMKEEWLFIFIQVSLCAAGVVSQDLQLIWIFMLFSGIVTCLFIRGLEERLEGWKEGYSKARELGLIAMNHMVNQIVEQDNAK